MTEDISRSNMPIDPTLIERAKNNYNYVRNAAGGEWLIFFIMLIFHFINVGFPVLFNGFGWFNGLNITYMFKTPSLIGKLLYTEVILNTTFWIIVIFFFLFSRGKNIEEFSSKILMVSAFFIVAVFSGINSVAGIFSGINILGTIIEIVLIITIRNAILRHKYDPIQTNYLTIFIIFLDFYMINAIQLAFPAQIVFINRIIFPVLPLAVLVFMDDSRLRNILIFTILVAYLLLFMNTQSNINAQFRQGLSGIEKESASQAAMTIKERVIALFTFGKASWEDSQRVISGDYYTGQVEEYETEPLGVFLEDVEASDNEFSQGETISVWATLKAYTLENNNVEIKVACEAKDGTKSIPGTITPRDKFTIYSYDEEFITCTFNENSDVSKNPKYYTVVFNATFSFKTQSYLKTYYIEKERLRVLRSENIDIFEEYGIFDRDPTAKFTNGPLKIGMETTTPPIGVPADGKEFSSYIGITLDNNWQGNLVKVNKIDLEIPQGLEIITTKDACDYFDNSGNNKYIANKNELEKDNAKKYVLPKSFKCPLAISSSDANLILGNVPISIKYFKSTVEYEYQITEKTTINVKSKN